MEPTKTNTPTRRRTFGEVTEDDDQQTPKHHQQKHITYYLNKKTTPIMSICEEDKTNKILKIVERLEAKLEAREEALDRLNNTVEEVLGELFSLRKENEKMAKEIDGLKKINEELKIETMNQRKQIEVNHKENNDLEQYTRRQNVKIYGLPENGQETATETEQHVTELIRTKLNIDITERDIDIAHRLGKKIHNHTRGVIVRLISRKMKDRIIKEKKKLKGTGISIMEDLTKSNYHLYKKALESQKVSQIWTRNGQIFCKDGDDNIRKINNETDLQKLPNRK